MIFPLKRNFRDKFSRFHKIFQEVPVKDQNFRGQTKSLKIFTLENFRVSHCDVIVNIMYITHGRSRALT